LVLEVVDSHALQTRTLDQLELRDALLVGLAQAVALVPGVSRSGATITMARALGFDRASAAQFSFMLALPISTGALIFKFKSARSGVVNRAFLAGILASGGVGSLSMRVLPRYLRSHAHTFLPFAVYRVVLALLIVVLYAKRRHEQSYL
jgi:undecaprenyl-diphosphatase